MKKILLPISFIAFGVGLWEQSQPQPRWYVLIICLGLFIYGAYYLNTKIPPKEEPRDEFEDRR